MKRIDRIYKFIKEESLKIKGDELHRKGGFSASEIAEKLGMLRNNVSMELNALLRMDKIIKIKGRPVLYFDKEYLEQLFNTKLPLGPLEVDNLNHLKSKEEKQSKEELASPFDLLIGANGSLKNQIEQAKAAVLYPPDGLHTLIVGPTGVGKTVFANMMYSYAKFSGRFGEASPFIVFNCADYYNNPQLLLSHIFGHSKGAFTGADSEKTGLVEKANGGILFLDEIHRLPPEGQEMIFYFMDTGTFNKLGETERSRKASVLIIGATTEDPNSSLLKTFIRRIPIIISIPSLEERPIKEKLDIIKHLFSKEALRVNKPIKVTAEVIKALVGSSSFGNIGQLKSNIQLICAKGFLNSINNNDFIEIDFKMLPKDIKDGLFLIGNKRKEIEEIAGLLDSTVIISSEGHKVLMEEDEYEPPFNLYKIIEDKANILKDEGMDEEYINKFITTDINIHIKSFYDKFKTDIKNRERILKIVDKDILQFSEEIQKLAEQRLNKKYSERFLYALSLHISAFLKRLKSDTPLKYTSNIESVIRDNPNEYKAAIDIRGLIEEKYKIIVPDMEVIYLTILLSSIQDVQKSGNVGIVVAAHGSSTASSMVNVAQKLLGEYNVAAVDMPLEVNPKEILEVVIGKVQEIDRGKGVLMLVDMGSLSTFGPDIEERTDIKVKTIDMVSTPLVLEAVRKANSFDMDLDSIYNSLKDFKGYGQYVENKDNKFDKVIVTICSTGEGTAAKLKQLVEDIIYNLTDEYINVIPVGIHDLKKKIEEIEGQYEIIASVGVIKPELEAPFISLESLIDGSGEKYLKEIIRKKDVKIIEKENKVVVKDLCEDSLKQFLTYLNPYKAISVLMRFTSVLEKEFDTVFTNSMNIRIIIHTGCALERMITKEGLTYSGDKEKVNFNTFNLVKKSSVLFKEALNIEISEDEIYYIAEMFEENEKMY